MMPVLDTAAVIAGADLRRELRRPIALASMVVFAIGSMVALHLGLAGSGRIGTSSTAGSLWIVLLMSAMVGAGRLATAERDNGTWDGLLLAPVDRSAMYLGKLVAGSAYLMVMHAIVLMAFAGMFGGPTTTTGWLQLGAIVATADIGFAAMGTLVGSITMFARGRDVLSAAIFVPLAMPILLAGVVCTLNALDPTRGTSTSAVLFCLLYDVIFVTVGIGVFPEIATE